jgi:hypothetical protein
MDKDVGFLDIGYRYECAELGDIGRETSSKLFKLLDFVKCDYTRISGDKHLPKFFFKVGPSSILGRSSFAYLVEGVGPGRGCALRHIGEGGDYLLFIGRVDCGVNSEVRFYRV